MLIGSTLVFIGLCLLGQAIQDVRRDRATLKALEELGSRIAAVELVAVQHNEHFHELSGRLDEVLEDIRVLSAAKACSEHWRRWTEKRLASIEDKLEAVKVLGNRNERRLTEQTDLVKALDLLGRRNAQVARELRSDLEANSAVIHSNFKSLADVEQELEAHSVALRGVLDRQSAHSFELVLRHSRERTLANAALDALIKA